MTTQNIANICKIESAISSIFNDSMSKIDALNTYFMLIDIISDPVIALSIKNKWLKSELTCVFSHQIIASELSRRKGLEDLRKVCEETDI